MKVVISIISLVGMPTFSVAFSPVIGGVQPPGGTPTSSLSRRRSHVFSGIQTARSVVIFPGDESSYFEDEEVDTSRNSRGEGYTNYNSYLGNPSVQQQQQPPEDYYGSSYSSPSSSSSNSNSDYNANPLDRLWDSLSSQKYTDLLARIACAFAPPQHRLHLEDLDGAHILGVDADHIEISAVLCEATGCVQVPIPVRFPTYCGEAEDVEECVLDNIDILDAQAYRLMSSAPSEQEEERSPYSNNYGAAEQQRQEQRGERGMVDDEDQPEWEVAYRLLQEEPATLPHWWTHPQPSHLDLFEECWHTKRFLNEAEELGPELVALAQQQANLEHLEGNKKHSSIVQASAAIVGPSGLVLRGLLVDQDGGSSVQRSRFTMVEVPIQFPQEVRCREELRESIMGLLSMAREKESTFEYEYRGSSNNSTSY